MAENNDGDVKNFGMFILQVLAKQGFSFMLLGLAVWYVTSQNQKMEARLNACNDTVISVYQEQNERLLDLVENNNRALEQNSNAIQNLSTLMRARK